MGRVDHREGLTLSGYEDILFLSPIISRRQDKMNMKGDPHAYVAEILDETVELTLGDLSRACAVHAELIVEMVEAGLVEPRGNSPSEWRFPGPSLRRVQVALRLQRDLDINLPGAALAIDLLDELEALRTQLRALKPDAE